MPRSETRLSAVLGPTNTGKTHLAVERMLAHRSGMIGLPLRLLAREIYDRVVAQKGARQAALITGEERIVPDRARYFVCTTESMPLDMAVEFLAVDEVQLCADPERGHVFTDRLLRARGTEETILMGAATMRPAIKTLLPDAHFIVRPRFSDLAYSGFRKLARLPPRSAVVAFSIPDVYELAEILRRQRGGCAVVLGALSPRARNAQIAMYQAGEVEHIVATDAIGMGLNMDVNHVAFAALRKFDGRKVKVLAPHEFAQIAGRAGRHTNDGTFGTTATLRGMDESLVWAIENHAFENVGALMWRNPSLEFRSCLALLKSLEKSPRGDEYLVRARMADDHRALADLVRDPEIANLASHPEAVRLLWEVCQVPDYRKVLHDHHVRLLAHIYRHLTGAHGRLGEDWVMRSISRLDRVDGDLDLLMSRIAHIRTWTYISHRSDWVFDHMGLQERTRAIEDRLSDALHERLILRFVDRRMAAVARRLRQGEALDIVIDDAGRILVEGEAAERLRGLQVLRTGRTRQTLDRAVASRTRRIAAREVARRVEQLAGDDASNFVLDPNLTLRWRGDPVARLVAGRSVLEAGVEVLASDVLVREDEERVKRRLSAWLEQRMAAAAGPLIELDRAEIEGAARGIAFQLTEGLGVSAGDACQDLIRDLDAAERRQLARLGVRLGTFAAYVKPLMSSLDLELRAALWSVAHGHQPIPNVPLKGEVALEADSSLPDSFWHAIGYMRLGPRALRVDMAERLAAEVRRLTRKGPAPASGDLVSLSGSSREAFAAIAEALGFRARLVDGKVLVSAPRRRRAGPTRRTKPPDPSSPFAELANMELAR